MAPIPSVNSWTSEVLHGDDHFAGLVDEAPFPALLDCCQFAEECEALVILRSNDDTPSPVDDTPAFPFRIDPGHSVDEPKSLVELRYNDCLSCLVDEPPLPTLSFFGRDRYCRQAFGEVSGGDEIKANDQRSAPVDVPVSFGVVGLTGLPYHRETVVESFWQLDLAAWSNDNFASRVDESPFAVLICTDGGQSFGERPDQQELRGNDQQSGLVDETPPFLRCVPLADRCQSFIEGASVRTVRQ